MVFYHLFLLRATLLFVHSSVIIGKKSVREGIDVNLTYVPVKIAKSIVLLVTSPVDDALRAQTAGWLLRRVDHAEQAVFAAWDGDTPRLETADGALTVNGAAALCAWLAGVNQLPAGETWTFPLPCCGGAFALNCAVTPVNACALVTVTLPQPERFSVAAGGRTLTALRYPGVSHVIVPAGELARAGKPEMLQSLGRELNTPRAGLLFWNEEARFLDPLLMSRNTAAPVWRQSSGSAAGALGEYLAGRLGGAVSVRMPGGTMAVTASGGAFVVTVAAETGGSRNVELVF